MLVKFGYSSKEETKGSIEKICESKRIYIDGGVGEIQYLIVKNGSVYELLEMVSDFASHESVRHIELQEFDLEIISWKAELCFYESIQKLYPKNSRLVLIIYLLKSMLELEVYRQSKNFRYLVHDIYDELISLLRIECNICINRINGLNNFVYNLVKNTRIKEQTTIIKEKMIKLSKDISIENTNKENHENILKSIVHIIYTMNENNF